MQFNTIKELLLHQEDSLSPDSYDDLVTLEPAVTEFVLKEINSSLLRLEPQYHRNEKKTKKVYDKRLITSLETSIKELHHRGLDDEAYTIQGILTNLLFDDELPSDKITADKEKKALREKYTKLFEEEFSLGKTKSKSLAKTITALLQ